MGQTLEKPVTEKETLNGSCDYLSYGLSCMQGFRLNMEDQHSNDLNVPLGDLKKHVKNPNVDLCFFGVYDGHSGASCAKYLASNLLKNMLRDETAFRAEKSGNLLDNNDVIKASYLNTDLDFTRAVPSSRPGESSGSTCASLFIVRDKNELEIIAANVGDSRMVVRFGEGTVKPLSFDHKPTNKEEKKRIEESGGFVEFGRVNGSLALSRAFGDTGYKGKVSLPQEKQAVIALPDIIRTKVDLTKSGHQFLVLACDGIWDVMTNEQACDFVHDLLVKQDRGTYYVDRIKHFVSLLERQGESTDSIEKQASQMVQTNEVRSSRGKYDLESIAEDLLTECVLKLDSKDNVSAIIVLFKNPNSQN